jgi:translation initiation factor 2A
MLLAGRTLFGIRPHSWEVLPVRKDDGVIRGPLNAAGGGGGGPGGKPASASASKNAKRRQKKAAAAAADAGGGGGSGGGGAVTEPAPAPAPAAAADPAKKARALQKKLRQIAELKEKQAGGAVLEANQLSKIEAEATLRAELEALGLG